MTFHRQRTSEPGSTLDSIIVLLNSCMSICPGSSLAVAWIAPVLLKVISGISENLTVTVAAILLRPANDVSFRIAVCSNPAKRKVVGLVALHRAQLQIESIKKLSLIHI